MKGNATNGAFKLPPPAMRGQRPHGLDAGTAMAQGMLVGIIGGLGLWALLGLVVMSLV